VLKFRSVKSIVIAPAKTGKERSKRKAVISTDHTNKGIRCKLIPGPRMLKIVVMKFTAPRIELIPERCKLKIARSTDPPEWKARDESGGYTVHPVPAPTSTNAEDSKRINDGGRSQKEMLFKRGKAISGAPIIMGTNQFPKPPIIAGITIKKIIRKACAVISTLYNWWFPARIWFPGWANSIRIKSEKQVPKTPDTAPKIKYKVPISLWLVEYIHLVAIYDMRTMRSLHTHIVFVYIPKILKENI
jgi:hypothetical protein